MEEPTDIAKMAVPPPWVMLDEELLGLRAHKPPGPAQARHETLHPAPRELIPQLESVADKDLIEMNRGQCSTGSSANDRRLPAGRLPDPRGLL